MSFNTFISDLHINEGDSIRIDCPSCNSRNTFTATKMDGNIVYNCYKLNCHVRGKMHSGYNKDDISRMLSRVKESPPKDNMFVLPVYVTTAIEDKRMIHFIHRWDIPVQAKVMYDIKDGRAVFPIYDTGGVMIDAIGRSLYNKQPKWLRYGGKAIHYTLAPTNRKEIAIIVEDVVSAITIDKHFPEAEGVAILGTSLSHGHKEFLQRYERVMVALDPDAKKKTLAFTKDMRNYVDDVTAINLVDDIKYKKDTDMTTIRRTISSWN
tara:strand:- start:9684 stop:10478 length:795 start_codon:yes stop_codon:yes gene_type:complete